MCQSSLWFFNTDIINNTLVFCIHFLIIWIPISIFHCPLNFERSRVNSTSTVRVQNISKMFFLWKIEQDKWFIKERHSPLTRSALHTLIYLFMMCTCVIYSFVSCVGGMITRLSFCSVTAAIAVTTPTASRSVYTHQPLVESWYSTDVRRTSIHFTAFLVD